ncbi:MAG: hypothetical protein WC144_01050 [Sulfurimonas sp.]
MKNTKQIFDVIVNQPQFSKLLEYKYINYLKSLLLPSYQNLIKYGYIKNQILTFVLKTNIAKQERDNIINIIKSILNLISKQNDGYIYVDIKDVVLRVDFSPIKLYDFYPKTIPHIKYKERAKGDVVASFRDEKLNKIAKEIMQIIKKHHES